MQRIKLGFSKLHKDRSEIVPEYCPYDIDKSLPDLDVDTYKFEDSCTERGCRGITCEECWDSEIS